MSDNESYERVEREDVASADGKEAAGGGALQSLVQEHLPRLMDGVFTLLGLLMKLEPLFNLAYKQFLVLYVALEPYNPEAVFQMATGVILMFFGGQFITTVAMITALKQGGGRELLASCSELWKQAKKASKAKQEDDLVDDDGDGVADVDQMSSSALVARRMKLFSRACDPQVVSTAMGHLYTSLLAAFASLKVRFARTVSLGAQIGDYANVPAQKFVVPVVKKITPKEYHKWYPTVFGYLCKFLGATVAFSIQRYLQTVSTGIFGGNMLIQGFAVFIHHQNKPDLLWMTEGYMDDALAWALCAVGIYAQLFMFHSLPAPVKLLLAPFYFVETTISFFVTK